LEGISENIYESMLSVSAYKNNKKQQTK